MPAATWVISRRYSEFHDLNKRLRGKFPQVRNLEFPRRQMMLKLQKDFLHKRRIGLEKYLRVRIFRMHNCGAKSDLTCNRNFY
jgi:sorting nexin-25